MHWEAIEADLAFRGIDALDLWRGAISLRRMHVLLRGLPASSAYKRAISPYGGLTETEWHTLGLVNLTRTGNYQRLLIGGVSADAVDAPEPIYASGDGRLLETVEKPLSAHERTIAKGLAFRARQAAKVNETTTTTGA